MARGTAVGTRERILVAAAALFRRRGLNGASVREIAAAADADPALVIRHFGSKEALFLEAMQINPDSSALFAGPVEDLGRDCVRYLLDFSDETQATFLALIRGSDTSAVARQLNHAHSELFLAPLRALLTGPDADLRTRIAASIVGGLMYSMWVASDEVLLATDHAVIIERYGVLLQQLITPAA